MNSSDFYKASENILLLISNCLMEHDDIMSDMDVDEADGMLTIKNSSGTFVINRQSAANQIWLSSPISGPHHFNLVDGRWTARGDVELLTLLQKELSIIF